MKKRLLLLIVLFAALTGAKAQTIDTLHVTGDNSTYSAELPIYGDYAHRGFHTEMLYPVSKVGTLAGNVITGLTFYIESGNQNVSLSETVRLYLEEVADTAFSNQFKMSNQAQLVWSGTVTISGGRWNITFDEPYIYGGGNLLVTTLCNGQTGGDYAYIRFAAYECQYNYPAVAGIATSSHVMPTTPNTICYDLPRISIAYSGIVCHQPQGLTLDSMDTHSATLHWDTVSGAMAYEWVLSSNGQTVDSGISALPSLTLTALTPATEYLLTLRSMCDSGSVSAHTSLAFTSACITYTLADLPFVEDFERYENNATGIPCWTMLAYSHPNYLRVEGVTSNKWLGLWPTSVSEPHFAVMPEMQDIPYLGMTFKKRCAAVQVGVMTDPNDTLTFTPIASFGPGSGTWQNLAVHFSSCPTTSGHIAFRVGTNGSYVEIDSIVVSQILFDTCVQPDTIYISDIQSDGATLNIVSSMASQHFMLYVAGDSVELFNNGYTITGLDDDSLYTIGVSSICADGSLTARTEVQFRTDTISEPPAPQEPFKYWVSFTDKQGSPYSLANPSAYLSQRALDRRTRKGVQIDSLDLPVNPAYVQAVRATGADVRYTSRWLNGLLAYLPADQNVNAIATLPCVAEVTCIDSIGVIDELDSLWTGVDIPIMDWDEPYSEEWYGYSYTQMKIHNAAAMHSAGYTGRGVLIGVLDGGFHSVDTNSVMRRAREEGRIVATRNFVEPSVSIYEEKESHGSNVLHFIGAYVPGYAIGTAMDAQFALCLTEDVRIENVTEEYHMVAALEFLDSLGADIVNASLGYDIYIPYEWRNGQTEVASIAGNIAAAKGMAFVVSAGNNGDNQEDPNISVPADAEFVFAVGAVAADSTAAWFTSIGPTADGRIKPDAASYGVAIPHAQYDGRFNVGYGTSYATPILCGLMACVLQQHPEYTPYQLYDTIRSWGHLFDTPNDTLGYGIPDFSRSLRNLTGISKIEKSELKIELFPNPAHTSVTVRTGDPAKVTLFDISGRIVASRQCHENDLILDLQALPTGTYMVRVVTANGVTVGKLIVR